MASLNNEWWDQWLIVLPIYLAIKQFLIVINCSYITKKTNGNENYYVYL